MRFGFPSQLSLEGVSILVVLLMLVLQGHWPWNGKPGFRFQLLSFIALSPWALI